MHTTLLTIRRLTSAATSLLVVGAALLFLFVFLGQATDRYRFVPVLSGSMSPFVEAGDVAILQPRAPEDLLVGDVVAFEAPVSGSTLTLHRVEEIISPAPDLIIRTKGDANEASDPWSARLEHGVVWRATHHVDDIGTPVLFLSQATTRFLLIGIGSLLLGAWGVTMVWRDPGDHDLESDGEGERSETVPSDRLTSEPSRRTSLPELATAVLVIVGLGVGFGAGEPVDASYTGSTSGKQAVTSAIIAEPFTLNADILCTGVVAEASVELVWTLAGNPVEGFEIYRGFATGGPYDVLVAQTTGDTFTYSDPLTGLDGLPLYYVVRTADPAYPVEETNEAFAIALCEPPAPPIT